jgi:peptide chain release factor 2
VNSFNDLNGAYSDAETMFQMAEEEKDESLLDEAGEMIAPLAGLFEKAEMAKMLSEENDAKNAIVTINAGSGGTESQDWAQMLYRMYDRWANAKGYQVKVMDVLPGDEAGIKSVAMTVNGTNAYGMLKSEADRKSVV